MHGADDGVGVEQVADPAVLDDGPERLDHRHQAAVGELTDRASTGLERGDGARVPEGDPGQHLRHHRPDAQHDVADVQHHSIALASNVDLDTGGGRAAQPRALQRLDGVPQQGAANVVHHLCIGSDPRGTLFQ